VIYPVGTLEQLAEICTKPPSSALFEKHKKRLPEINVSVAQYVRSIGRGSVMI
jgi:hypothetical protein